MTPPGLRLVNSGSDLRSEQEPLRSVVLIGNYPPRRCGIATFTSDVRAALCAALPELDCPVFAMDDPSGSPDYPPEVVGRIRQHEQADYHAAASQLNAIKPDVIFVQHEFGIFGGPAGEDLMLVLESTDRPVVSMLHTVLDKPDPDQRRVFERLLSRSAQVIVMAERGRDILRRVWNVADENISVIPHGAPDRPLAAPEPFKAALGFEGRELLFTFGLLSPNKGIETVIRALPAIAKARPKVLYAVLGATHPNLVAQEGERYRDSLIQLARDLGVESHLRLIDQYTDAPLLLDHLQATDVYVTPYLNAAQVTSGTLSYAAALGCAIVSTPYWHAEELLADGLGRLTPFGDVDAVAREVIDLLSDDDARQALRERIYARSRATIWSRFAARVISALEKARLSTQRPGLMPLTRGPYPAATMEGVRRMTDDCGMYQHSLFGVADRRHGYCVDDNARALMLMHRLPGPPCAERRRLTHIYAAFVHHAWNSDRGRFRNFMSFERTWLEQEGSEDSTARAFWSMASTAAQAQDPSLRRWAEALLPEMMARMGELNSPRSIAFVLLGLAELAHIGWQVETVQALMISRLAVLRNSMLARMGQGQPWFEDVLAYDNARLPEALIRAGLALDDAAAVQVGLQTLNWLCRRTTSADGWFTPVSTRDLGRPLETQTLFDQQPLEAAATIDACEAAFFATSDAKWIAECERAFAWYFGANTLGAIVAGPNGECYDGLTWNGPNENRGAESILSLQLATCAHQRLTAMAADRQKSGSER